tara:strand:+ start:28 stop:561 length:534 start_codon:yes stop_codon:yes gene_type:complete
MIKKIILPLILSMFIGNVFSGEIEFSAIGESKRASYFLNTSSVNEIEKNVIEVKTLTTLKKPGKTTEGLKYYTLVSSELINCEKKEIKKIQSDFYDFRINAKFHQLLTISLEKSDDKLIAKWALTSQNKGLLQGTLLKSEKDDDAIWYPATDKGSVNQGIVGVACSAYLKNKILNTN